MSKLASIHHTRTLRCEQLEVRNLLTSFVNVIEKLDDHRPGGFSGAAWFDFNNDGRDDLFSNGVEGGTAALYRNEADGTFTNVAEEAGIAPFTGYSAANAGDIDNDGYTDLILVGLDDVMFKEAPPAIVVLRNMGDGTFTDVSDSSGIVPPNSPGAAAFADVDRDSDIDFFITSVGDFPRNVSYSNKLFRNNGDFSFTDVTDESGLGSSGPWSCVAGFTDYDNDGDSDLIVANCNKPGPSKTPMQLFQNDGEGNFSDVSTASRVTQTGFWMGLAYADYNNDGNIDFHVTNAGTQVNGCCSHLLYQNNGDGTFSDTASRTRVSSGPFGWGNSSADFNNDGFADLLYVGTLTQKQLSFGNINFIEQFGNKGVLHLNEAGSFEERFPNASSELGIDMGNVFSAGLATSDYDNNGTVDVFIPGLSIENDRANSVSRSVLLENNLAAGTHWVGVSLTGTTSNRDAIGARITVAAGDLLQTREVYGGSSFLSTDSFSQRFGLGQYEGEIEFTVRWPTGVEETFRVDGALDSVVELVEGESVSDRPFGDSNGDGVFDSSDLTLVFVAGEYEDGIDGNSTYEEGDWNGDGDFDTGDLVDAFTAGTYVSTAHFNSPNVGAATVDSIFKQDHSQRRRFVDQPAKYASDDVFYDDGVFGGVDVL